MTEGAGLTHVGGPGGFPPGHEGFFALGDEEGVVDGVAAEVADLVKGEIPADHNGKIVAGEDAVGLVGGVIGANHDGNAGLHVLLGGVLGKVAAITKGGVGNGADFHADTLLQNGFLKLRISVQIESVAKAVNPTTQGDSYLLILAAEAFAGMQSQAQAGVIY